MRIERRKKTALLTPGFSIDTSDSLENRYNIEIVGSLEEALSKNPQTAVIATPTSKHVDYAIACAKAGCNILLEKPFSHTLEGLDEFRSIVQNSNKKFLISFQRRFHPLVQKTKEMIDAKILGTIYQATFNTGSYVPAWHPYEDYKSLYACRADLGGGVLLTECHEIDLCYLFFGNPESVYCKNNDFHDLGVEDTSNLILNYPEFTSVLNLCFMQKKAERTFQISGSDGYLNCDLNEGTLTHFDYATDKKESTQSEVTNDDMFIDQNQTFLTNFDSKTTEAYLDAANSVQKVIDLAKVSAASHKEIRFE